MLPMLLRALLSRIMIISRVKISRFRAIRSADLVLDEPLIALLGSGDSGKTTLLEAIAWTLWPDWRLRPSDTDFTDCDASQPILIEVTVRPVPDSLLPEHEFGLYLRGWHARTKTLHDEPEDDDEPALTVRLRISSSLEPEWEVITERHREGRWISAAKRRRIGVHRLGEDVDRHLGWGRGSALLSLTDDTGETQRTLAQLNRNLLRAVSQTDLPELRPAVKSAEESAVTFGAGAPAHDMRAAMDPKQVSGRMSTLSLHSGKTIPLSRAGIGTKRTLALGIQASSVTDGAVLLIDEMERGLEPFRIRHVLRVIRAALGLANIAMDVNADVDQVILTTQSPVVVAELPCEFLRRTRLDSNGLLALIPIGSDLQGIVRSHSEVLLGRRVLIGEGKTEEGILRALADFWAMDNDCDPIANRGVVIACGEGSKAPRIASDLRTLGFDVCLLADSDVDPSRSKELEGIGVDVYLWSDAVSTEERLSIDLPIRLLELLLANIGDERGWGSVVGEISTDLKKAIDKRHGSVRDWLNNSIDEDQLRAAIGKAMKRCAWIKRVDHGEMVGEVLAGHWNLLNPSSDLVIKLAEIKNWCYRQ